MQTLVFTLIPWILDQVENDKRGHCEEAVRHGRSNLAAGFLLSFLPPRGNPVGGVEKVNFAVIPASARESSVVTDNITLQITFLNAN